MLSYVGVCLLFCFGVGVFVLGFFLSFLFGFFGGGGVGVFVSLVYLYFYVSETSLNCLAQFTRPVHNAINQKTR